MICSSCLCDHIRQHLVPIADEVPSIIDGPLLTALGPQQKMRRTVEHSRSRGVSGRRLATSPLGWRGRRTVNLLLRSTRVTQLRTARADLLGYARHGPLEFHATSVAALTQPTASRGMFSGRQHSVTAASADLLAARTAYPTLASSAIVSITLTRARPHPCRRCRRRSRGRRWRTAPACRSPPPRRGAATAA